MIYNIVSLGCIAVMTGILIYFVIKYFTLDYAGKKSYIRNFKKGKCAVIYVVAVPLFLMAYVYEGKDVLPSVFNAISKAVQLVVLKYDVPVKLASDNTYFAVALYMCFSLVIVNAVMITVSVLQRYIWGKYRIKKFEFGRKDKCIIIGNNDKSKSIYSSCAHKKMIVDILDEDGQQKLFTAGLTYKAFKKSDRMTQWMGKEINRILCQLRKIEKRNNGKPPAGSCNKLYLIINNDDEKLNLDICGRFIEVLSEQEDGVVNYIDAYVFGDREFEDIYTKYEEHSRGCLHYVNEYRQIALDFADKHPLTEYMTDKHIDYKTSLIKSDVDMNVAMIGFGKTNQHVFMSMVANNQFLYKDSDDKIVAKCVTYHLFDRLHKGEHKNLNHNYYRYKHNFYEDKLDVHMGDYLPLPDIPAKDQYHYFDINDINFYGDFKSCLSFKPDAINYIVISLGADYQSIDVANKIAAKLKEWRLNNCHVFVRIRDKKISNDAKLFFNLGYCHPFGAYDETVYDFAHITQEKFSEMAIMRNYIYDIEHDMKHEIVSDEERANSRIKWYVKRNAIERESNVYACLGLRPKLHLMGMDYVKKSERKDRDITYDEFMSVYACDDMPQYVQDDKGKNVAVRYSLHYKNSRRKLLAMQEHLRWNAFMLVKGFIPATKSDILNEKTEDGEYTNGKSYIMRHHGNLTTFEGLEEYRRMLAVRDNIAEEKYDVIKYDYQLLDGVQWLLDRNDFCIVKR